MAEIISSIAAKVSEYLVPLVIRQGQYLFHFRKISKNLESKKVELISTRDHVQNEVEATNKTRKVNDAVLEWLNAVKNLIEEVEKLEKELETNSSCFRGQCPIRKRYRLYKQMEKKIETLIQLNKECVFEPLSFPAQIPGIEYFSSEKFMWFESTKKASDQLLEALQDDSSYIIGFYGMGGSGKTTLVKEVGKKAEDLKLFDRVVFATVSQTPNVKKIQDEIADYMGLKLDENSEAGRARRISLSLQSKERILVILDDVWAKLELEDIGIPCNGNNWEGKVLLTTRLLRVCTLMDCQREIPLHLLSEEEAWMLFQKHSGIGDKSPSNLLNVAREVATECKGLPIAIQAVGCSLKRKPIEEWKAALESLRHSKPTDVEEGVRDAFSCLQLSYNHLKSNGAKMLFLMCSMFPEDHEIYIEDLIRYGVGLGICGEVESFESARCQFRASINKLVDSCLLMHPETIKEHFSFEYVQMHDVVRDVALWIASRSVDRNILVNLAKDLNTLAEDGDINKCFAVSSWHKKTDRIAVQVDAPKLEILLLNARMSLDLLNASFEGIKGIKVMTIISEAYEATLSLLSLPHSTQSLTNLRTLCLRKWELGDISFILSLRKLEVLDLQDCCFKELPNEIEKLSKLKLLDLSRCVVLENYNSKAIGSCTQLEELYVSGPLFNQDSRCIYPCQHFVDDFVTLPNLRRHILGLGRLQTGDSGFKENSSMRVLRLKEFDISLFCASKMNLLQRADDMFLNRLHGGCKNIIPEMVQAVGGMNDLTKFWLRSCSEIECLIDTTSNHAVSFHVDALLPGLVKLGLEEMENLKEFWHGPPLQVLGFFEKLEELHIRDCQQLHSIFPGKCKLSNLKILKISGLRFIHSPVAISSTAVALFSMSVVQSLEQLEELFIADCKELRHIISTEEKDGTVTEEEISPALGISHLILPNLKKLSIQRCPDLEFVFPSSSVGLVKLQVLQIHGASALKYIFGHYDHEHHPPHQNGNQIKLPVLKVFKLGGLANLLGICTGNYQPWWPSLKELSCRNCPKLSISCIHMMVGSELRQQHLNTGVSLDEDQKKHLTSTLEGLALRGLSQLRLIWSDPTPKQILSLQYLQWLEVGGCVKLKSVFSMVVHRSLPELTVLDIYHCEELEEIIAENEESQNLTNAKVCFPKLRHLAVKKCNKLKSLFSVAMVGMLPQLSTLYISEAVQLKEVFRHGIEDSIVHDEKIVFPNLREIELTKLPSLVGICQGFKLQRVKAMKVLIDECPKLAPISEAT